MSEDAKGGAPAPVFSLSFNNLYVLLLVLALGLLALVAFKEPTPARVAAGNPISGPSCGPNGCPYRHDLPVVPQGAHLCFNPQCRCAYCRPATGATLGTLSTTTVVGEVAELADAPQTKAEPSKKVPK